MLSHMVAQRKRELGIRVAVGAQLSHIMRFVFHRGLRLTGIGAVLGFCCALAVTHLIESYLYGVSPTDPISFAVVGLVLVSVTLLACWFPALRAVRTDPVQALREE